MREKMEVAREAILSAGSLIRESFGREQGLLPEEKDRNDFVTETDRQSERMIKETLSKVFPEIGFLAEEEGSRPEGDSYWIVDPLDGTTNFIHGFPHIAVTIALVDAGRIVLGLAYDPLREELFEASLGGGAFLGGEPIEVSRAERLEDALLGTGFPFRIHRQLDDYMALFRELFSGCRGVRRAGAAVLDLAYVAAGRLDGFFELGLNPWDVAAGALLIREAGGTVTDFFNGPAFVSSGTIVAGPGPVHRALVRETERFFTAEKVAPLAIDPPLGVV